MPSLEPSPIETAPQSAPEETERSLRGLSLFLRQTRDFRLAIALYNDPIARQEFIHRLSEELAVESILVLALDLAHSADQHSLLAGVAELAAADAGGFRRTIMVINMEGRVQYNPELPLLDGPDAAFLANANFHRDRFPIDCPVPMVIWMTELLERAFAVQAPDLWHWRSHVFDLRTRPRRSQLLVAADGLRLSSDDYRLHPEVRLAQLEEELAGYRKSGSRIDELRVLNAIGRARLDAGDARLAIRDFEEVLHIAIDLKNRFWESVALGNLAIAYQQLGDLQTAVEHHEKVLLISREIGNRAEEASALGNLGVAYRCLGDAPKAIDYIEQQLSIAREMGNRRAECHSLANLGKAYADLQDTHKAVEHFERALIISREIGDRRAEAFVLGNLGTAYDSLGDTSKAIDYYERQLSTAREIGDRHGEGNALLNFAVTCESLGKRAEAINRARSALAIFDAIHDPSAAMVRQWLAEQENENSQ
jgi:tetratricopeptide (TPR) repeat protein